MQSPPMPGFYNPAIPQPRPGTPPTAGSPPAFPQPRIGLPPSLVPGRRPTFTVPRSQSNDYFFQNDSPSFHVPPRHTQTAPVPPLPRKPDFDQPPLPPKPSLSPTATSAPTSPPLLNGAALYASPEPSPLPSAPPLPPPPPRQHEEDDDILHRVLEISAQESQQSHGEPMLSEEEQLARAMEESLKMSSRFSVPSPDRPPSIMTSSPEQGPTAPSRHSIPDLDITLASLSRRASQRVSGGFRLAAAQISADEALARQLAEEEERLLQEEEDERRRSAISSPSQPPLQSPAAADAAPSEPDALPQYDEAVSTASAASSPHASSFYNSSLTAHFPGPANGAGSSRPGSPSRMTVLNRSISDKPVPSRSSVSLGQDRPLGRSQSYAESSPVSASTLMAPTSPATSSTSDLQEGQGDDGSDSPGSPGVDIVSNTQYLDAELLAGLGTLYPISGLLSCLVTYRFAQP